VAGGFFLCEKGLGKHGRCFAKSWHVGRRLLSAPDCGARTAFFLFTCEAERFSPEGGADAELVLVQRIHEGPN